MESLRLLRVESLAGTEDTKDRGLGCGPASCVSFAEGAVSFAPAGDRFWDLVFGCGQHLEPDPKLPGRRGPNEPGPSPLPEG